MQTETVPRESWWTRPIPRESWRLVVDAEQPFVANSVEGRKQKLLEFKDYYGEIRRFKTARELES